MNLMSSIAKTLVGSVIAIVSVLPERLSGMIWYLRAVSVGTSLMIVEVDLEAGEVDRRNAVLLAEQRGDLLVLDEPHLDEVVAELPPVGLLLVKRLLQLLRCDQFLLEEELAYRTAMKARAYSALTKSVKS